MFTLDKMTTIARTAEADLPGDDNNGRKVEFPDLEYVQGISGNVREIVQYRADVPDLYEILPHFRFPSAGNFHYCSCEARLKLCICVHMSPIYDPLDSPLVLLVCLALKKVS